MWIKVVKNGSQSQLDDAAAPRPEGVKWLRSSLVHGFFPPFTSYHSPPIMAIARPIRMLGAACVLLTLFLIFNLRQSTDQPTTKLTNGMTRDPLLDRAFLCHSSVRIYPTATAILTFMK